MRALRSIAALLVLMSNANVAGAACTMHVGWWIYPDQRGDIWLAEQHCNGRNHWQLMEERSQKILAQMPVPPLPKGHRFNYGQCERDGVLRNDVIAIVRHDPAVEWSTAVTTAWLLDPAKRAFTPIATAGLSCHFAGYGL